MKTIFSVLLLATFAINTINAQKEEGASRIKVLIIDGQNNHEQWPKTTHMLKTALLNSGLFLVDIDRTAHTWKGDTYISDFFEEGVPNSEPSTEPVTDDGFSPDFSKYDVVISNFGWNAAPWPKATQKSFEQYIIKGGGLVVFHAANNAFPQWRAYNRMIGLGGWGDRTEKDGPYVYYNDVDEVVRDASPGNAGAHGPESEYQVQVRNAEHPITKGMPTKWMHTKDELYSSLRGPATHMEILATAYADPNNKGTGRHEPALMALSYGKGRIFHNIMGHADYSVNCIGFITTMLRGVEWAASGEVTQKIPSDFPTAQKSSPSDILGEN